MDVLRFDKDQTIVVEGHCMPDVPLSGCLMQHQLNGATITQIVREVDPKQKFAFTSKNETYGIYGYSDFSPQ